jgi:hypothetical protein
MVTAKEIRSQPNTHSVLRGCYPSNKDRQDPEGATGAPQNDGCGPNHVHFRGQRLLSADKPQVALFDLGLHGRV